MSGKRTREPKLPELDFSAIQDLCSKADKVGKKATRGSIRRPSSPRRPSNKPPETDSEWAVSPSNDEELEDLRQAMDGLRQKRQKMAERSKAKAMEALSSRFLSSVEKTDSTLSKLSQEGQLRLQRQFGDLVNLMEVKHEEIQTLCQQHMKAVTKLWEEYKEITTQGRQKLRRDAQREAVFLDDQCKKQLDELQQKSLASLEETKEKILNLEETSGKLPATITSLLDSDVAGT